MINESMVTYTQNDMNESERKEALWRHFKNFRVSSFCFCIIIIILFTLFDLRYYEIY